MMGSVMSLSFGVIIGAFISEDAALLAPSPSTGKEVYRGRCHLPVLLPR